MNNSNSTNVWFFLGAAIIGAVSAASVFLIEQFRQDKRRHALTKDLKRLDGQLATIRKEVEILRALQKEKYTNNNPYFLFTNLFIFLDSKGHHVRLNVNKNPFFPLRQRWITVVLSNTTVPIWNSSIYQATKPIMTTIRYYVLKRL